MTKSEASHAVLDEASRRRKAEKIIKVLEHHTDLAGARVLDIGTGSGHIAHTLAQRASRVDSVDLHDERMLIEGYDFHQVQGEALPFDDAGFDIVITNHVIEHVPDQRLHLAEIARVLRPGGLAYLATPNKFWLTDPHFKLPFVSWLPRGLAERYVRRACHGRHWDIYPLSYRRLRTLTRGKFVLHDMTPDVVKAPSRFGLNVPAPARAVMERAPRPLLRVASVAAPSFIVILRKR